MKSQENFILLKDIDMPYFEVSTINRKRSLLMFTILYSGENRMKLTENLLKINDVHQLVEQLSNILQKAIVLENKNFELITYSSPNETSFDPVQQKRF